MKHYILVHGAWGGAQEFEEVAKVLSADGSNVIALDLPGHGNSKESIIDVSMDAYVQRVTDVINDLDEKVTLVGHSLAGAVISQVAEGIPLKIDRLIYVCAFLPKNGDTPLGLMQSDKKGKLLPKIVFSEDQSYATLKDEDIRDIFLHDVEDEEYINKLIPKFSIKQAIQPFIAPAKLSTPNFRNVSKYYIRTSLDKVVSLSLQDEMISNWHAEQTFTLDSGHFPLTSMPNDFCETIKKIV